MWTSDDEKNVDFANPFSVPNNLRHCMVLNTKSFRVFSWHIKNFSTTFRLISSEICKWKFTTKKLDMEKKKHPTYQHFFDRYLPKPANESSRQKTKHAEKEKHLKHLMFFFPKRFMPKKARIFCSHSKYVFFSSFVVILEF